MHIGDALVGIQKPHNKLDMKTSYYLTTRLNPYLGSCAETIGKAQYRDSQSVQCKASGSMVLLEECG